MTIPRFRPRSISATIEKLTKPLFARRGLGHSVLINNWLQIVGDELAQHTSPDKISFPKNDRNGGILHIRIDSPALAIELQHKETQLIENVNSFFGYYAVKAIKIKQSTLSVEKNKNARIKNPLTNHQRNKLDSDLRIIKDPELKKALLALGTEIKASQRE